MYLYNLLAAGVAEDTKNCMGKTFKTISVASKLPQTLRLYTFRPLWPKNLQSPSAQIPEHPGSNHSQSLMASNFAAF